MTMCGTVKDGEKDSTAATAQQHSTTIPYTFCTQVSTRSEPWMDVGKIVQNSERAAAHLLGSQQRLHHLLRQSGTLVELLLRQLCSLCSRGGLVVHRRRCGLPRRIGYRMAHRRPPSARCPTLRDRRHRVCCFHRFCCFPSCCHFRISGRGPRIRLAVISSHRSGVCGRSGGGSLRFAFCGGSVITTRTFAGAAALVGIVGWLGTFDRRLCNGGSTCTRGVCMHAGYACYMLCALQSSVPFVGIFGTRVYMHVHMQRLNSAWLL